VRRFVHISTFAVHDLKAGGLIDETTPPNPPRGNDYAESKAEADKAVEQAVRDGLCAVTLRLPNVYGPFSTIFTTRPIQAMAKDRLVLVGAAAEIPSSTMYVDNVVEAIVRALDCPDESARGQLYTISDGDALTWAEFYGYFAKALGVPLRTISDDDFARQQRSRRQGWLDWILTPFRGVKEIVTSEETWALTKRVLKTEPVYTLGKSTLAVAPPLNRLANRWLGIDAPVVYHRVPPPAPEEPFEFELTRRAVSNAKAQRMLHSAPPVCRQRAMELTLEWLRNSRIVP
jgi:nucleoside-diphosphate-sugar epimerase